MTDRETALRLHRAGRLDDARAAYQTLLTDAPDDADILGLLGVVDIQAGQGAEAEARLRRTFAISGQDPRIHLRNANNLMAYLIEQKRSIDAFEFAEQPLPDWPDAVVPDAAERRTLLSLVRALAVLGQHERARTLLDSVIERLDRDAEVLALAGRLALKCEDAAAALDLLNAVETAAPGDPDIAALIISALDTVGETEAARTRLDALVSAAPAFVGPAASGQEGTVLVLNPRPLSLGRDVRGLREVHFRSNYITQAAVSLQDRFRFASIFGDLDPPVGELPPADVVFNNMASSEQMAVPGRLESALAVIERAGLPVINHPRAILDMTRPKAAEKLRGIPGLLVPQIHRFNRDPSRFDALIDDVAQNFAYPVIVRHVAADGSAESLYTEDKIAYLVDDEAELRRVIGKIDWPQLYVIQYVDLRKPDGNWRKIRAAYVGGEINMCMGAHFDRWLVGGWRIRPVAEAFYQKHPHLLKEMDAIMLDPETALGTDVMNVVRAVGERVPLDVFGMDFDVDENGVVVAFEVQSTMIFNQFDGIRRWLRMPEEVAERIDASFVRLVRRKMEEGPARTM